MHKRNLYFSGLCSANRGGCILLLLFVMQLCVRGEVLQWEQVHYEQPDAGYGEDLDAVAYGNGVYVATGDRVFASTNAVDWIDTGFVPAPNLWRVIYAGGRFVAVGGGYIRYYDNNNSIIAVSDDGFHWTTVLHEHLHTAESGPNGDDLFLTDVTYGPDGYLAVGNGSGKAVYKSSDGTNWFQIKSVTQTYCNAVTYANGLYISVGTGLIVSTNGIDWESRTLPEAIPFEGSCVGYYGGHYFAAGSDVGMWESEDTKTWFKTFLGVQSFRGIAGALGEIVTVSALSIQQRVATGNWVADQLQSNWEPGGGVVFGNGYFVAVGHHNLILRAKANATVTLSLARTGMTDATVKVSTKPGLMVDVEESTDLESWTRSASLVTSSASQALGQQSSGTQKFFRAVAH